MAPKQKQKDTDQGLTGPAARLRTRALALGVLANEKPPATETLPIPKALLKCNGQDIIKKSTVRKNRYLIVLNCQLAPVAAGKLGTLAQLDSNQPVMYIDFPTGRLKLFGALVFPRNKYAVLRTGGQAGVLCEDVFESMVVFSEAWWVGTKEENPSEERLVMPFELTTTQLHQEYDHTYGAAAAATNTAQGRQQAQATVNGSQLEAVDMTASQPLTQEVPGSANRPRRAAAKRNYAVDLDDEEGGNQDDEFNDDASDGNDVDSDQEGRGRRQTTPGAAKTVSTVRASGPVTALDEDVNDDVMLAPLTLKKLTTSRTPTKTNGRASAQKGGAKSSTAARGKGAGRKRKAASESEEDEISSDFEESEDDDLNVSESDGSPAEDDQDEEDSQKSEGDEDQSDNSDDDRKKPAAEKQVAAPQRKPPIAKTPATQARKTTKTAGTATTAKGSKSAPAKQKAPTTKKRSRKGSDSDGDDEDADAIELSDGDDGYPAAGLSSQRPTRRAAAAKKPKYADDDDNDEEDGSDGDSDKEPSSSPAEEDDGDDDDYDGDSDAKPKSSKARGTTGKNAGRQAKSKPSTSKDVQKTTGSKQKKARGHDTDEDDYEPIEIDLSD